MNSHPRTLLVLLALVAAGLSGCASVKTLPDGADAGATRLRRPAEIYIRPFDTNDGMWQRDAAEPARRAEIRDWLSGNLLRHLAALAPTQLVEGEPVNASGWLVTGRFLRVNPGSRVKRMLLGGVGAGASKLETRVEVYDLAVSSTQPILGFTTTGGSNLAAGIPGALTAIDADIERTAREIHDFLAARLWPADGTPEGAAAPRSLDEVKIPPRGPR